MAVAVQSQGIYIHMVDLLQEFLLLFRLSRLGLHKAMHMRQKRTQSAQWTCYRTQYNKPAMCDYTLK